MERIPAISQMRQVKQHCLQTMAAIDKLAEAVREPAAAIRAVVADLYTTYPVGYYWHPEYKQAGFSGLTDLPACEQAYCLRALDKAAEIYPDELDGSDPTWIKVAWSPLLRRIGELLNFFPGKYVAGIPNSAAPIQSMLTSGLVGAGLGYGAGWAGEKLLPGRWEKNRLRNVLAGIGGAAGVVPGLTWGLTNTSIGKPFNSPDLLSSPPPPNVYPDSPGTGIETQAEYLLSDVPIGTRHAVAIAKTAEELGWNQAEFIKEAFGAGSSYSPAWQSQQRTPLSVNINAMGQTLWEVGADPQTAAMTMGALHAAQRMPGGDRAGWVTPRQMARLAANMGAGYLSGAVVGATLGQLIGLPEEAQSTLKRTGTWLGVVQHVVPTLFGGD